MQTYIAVGQQNWREKRNGVNYITHKVPETVGQAIEWSTNYERHTRIVCADSPPGCRWGEVLYVWNESAGEFVYLKDNADSSG